VHTEVLQRVILLKLSANLAFARWDRVADNEYSVSWIWRCLSCLSSGLALWHLSLLSLHLFLLFVLALAFLDTISISARVGLVPNSPFFHGLSKLLLLLRGSSFLFVESPQCSAISSPLSIDTKT